MNDLWISLDARSEAHDTYINSTQAQILGKKTGRIQPKLRQKLEKKCSLSRLLGNRPALHRRTRAIQEKAIKVRRNAPATIREDSAFNPGPPKMPRLSEKRTFESWIKESLQVYARYIGSDLVDASIKPRTRKIRQSLWSYSKTGEGIGIRTSTRKKLASIDLCD